MLTPGDASAAEPEAPTGEESPRRRRRFALSIVASLVVIANAWMVVLVHSWREESDRLERSAASLGNDVAAARARNDALQAEIEAATALATDAAEWSSDLADDARTAEDVTESYLDAFYALKECADDRHDLFTGMWRSGEFPYATLAAETAAECAAAEATFDALEKGTAP